MSRSGVNASAVESVVREYLQRRAGGEQVDVQALAACRPELMPALERELQKASRIAAAREQARRETGATELETHPAMHETDLGGAGGSLSDGSEDFPRDFGPRYQLLRRLGEGGMGTVYLAEDRVLNRQVALKAPRIDPRCSEELKKRFEREARAMAALRHPSICAIYDIGEVAGSLYLTMPYLEGASLADRLRSRKPVTPDAAGALVCRIAAAMQVAHAAGVIHRDLKPSNIMLGEDGAPVIMDFGLARRNEAPEAGITQSGAIVGTPAYMSPEQVDSEFGTVGPQSDIYSLGVILYQLLTGEVPFKGTAAAVLGKILSDPVRPPSEIVPGLPGDLENLCQRMVARRPDQRPASMADVVDSITNWNRGSDATTNWTEPHSAPTSTAETLLKPSRLVGQQQETKSSRKVRRYTVVWGAALGSLALGIMIWAMVTHLADSDEADAIASDESGRQSVAERDSTRTADTTLPGAEGSPGSVTRDADTGAAAAPAENEIQLLRTLGVGSQIPTVHLSLALGADGRSAFAMLGQYSENAAAFWDTEKGHRIFQIPQRGHDRGGDRIALSPTESTIALGYADGLVEIWQNGSPPRRIHQFQAHTGRITGIGFLPDGSRLITCTEHKRICEWDPATWSRIREITAPSACHSLAISPDGDTVATGGPALFLWSLKTGERLHHLELFTFSVDFSPDGSRLLAVSGKTPDVSLFEVSSGRKLDEFVYSSGTPLSVRFLSADEFLVGSTDRTLKIWSISKREVLAIGHAERMATHHIAVAPAAGIAVSASSYFYDLEAERWSDDIFAPIHVWRLPRKYPAAAASGSGIPAASAAQADPPKGGEAPPSPGEPLDASATE